GLPEHSDGVDKCARAADLALPFVKDWFGQPREKVQLLELADRDAAPFESGSIVLTPLGKSDSALARLTAVHQLTHAAFYSPRPWIYEGVARFMPAAYKEQENGRQAALDFMGLHRTA